MTYYVGYKAFGRDAGWASNCRVCTYGKGAGRQGYGFLDGRVCIERGWVERLIRVFGRPGLFAGL